VSASATEIRVRVLRFRRVFFTIAAALAGLAGCEPDFFGPDTEVGGAIRTGTVTSSVDGSPIAGARIYWFFFGLVVGSDPLLVSDTEVADAAGHYRLETEFYCDAQLSAEADGYVSVRSNLSYLACPDNQPKVVDIVLEPAP